LLFLAKITFIYIFFYVKRLVISKILATVYKMRIMKRSTKAFLPTTQLTIAQKTKGAPHLPFALNLKALGTAVLLLLVLSMTNKAYAVARSGALAAGTVPTSTIICKGTTSQVIYSFKFTQTGTNTLNSFTFTTSGLAPAADVTGYSLYWNTTNSFTGATLYNSVSTGTGPGTHTISGSKSLTATSWFFFVVADISSTAAIGDDITVTAITNSTASGNFSFSNTENYSGAAAAGLTMLVTAPPSVSAGSAVCPGSSSTLVGAPTGGTWASSATAIATVGTNGVVTGVGNNGGTAIISYTQGGCPATTVETVNPAPSPIVLTPASSYTVCTGSGVAVTAAANTATITLLAQNFNSGLTGQVGGAWTIVNTGATSPQNWSIQNPPGWSDVNIPGDGSPFAEADADQAGFVFLTTSLISPSFSTVGFPAASLNSNVYMKPGGDVAEIDYSTDGGSSWNLVYNYQNIFNTTTGTTSWSAATPTQTIVLPAGAMGQSNVKLRWYYSSYFEWYWAVDNISVTVSPQALPATAFTWAGPSGLSCTSNCYTSTLTPAAGGLNIYTVTALYNGCTATKPVSVNVVVPQTILTNAPVCVGASTTTLTNVLSGGTWSSSNTGVAAVGSTSGVLTGVSPGVSTITYTVPPGCSITAQATVNPLPDVSSFNTSAATNPCAGSGSVVSVNASTLGSATYTVQYSLSGANTGTGTATLVTSSGLGTFTTSALANAGATTVTITSVSNLLSCNQPVTTGNTVSFTVNPLPAGITGTATVCAGQTTTLADAVTGGTWSSSNTSLATVDASGNITGVAGGAPLISYTISSGCAATRAVTVNAAPPITGLTGLCVGQTTTLTDAASGGTWNSSNTTVATIDPSAGIVTSVALGTTVISYTSPATGCTATTSLAVTNTPGLFTVTGGGTYCPGSVGVHIGLTGSNPGVSYQLFIGATAIGSPVTGTGGVIDFGFETSTGTYQVIANPGTPCAVTMTGTAVVSTSASPALYIVGGGGSYCAGGIGVPVTLSGSDFAFNYQLYNGAVPVGSPLPGVSGLLNFGLQTASGNYTVVAINGTTGCSRTMTGSATVTTNPKPGAYLVTGGGGFCASATGVPVGLANSDAGVTYTLLRGATVVYTTTGTGALLNFGLQNIGGTYTVTAVSGAGCTTAMTGSATVIINPLPPVSNVTGGGAYCAGGTGVHIGLNGSAVGVQYQLTSGAPVGAPMIGTSFPLDFGLLTVAATYSVTATNTTTGCSSSMAGSATVTVNVVPVNTYSVTGGGTFCTGDAGFTIGLSGSTSGIKYQLLNGLTPVGSIITGGGSTISFGTITTAGTYSVQATNTTTGCTSIMTGTASIIVNNPPPAFNVLGGGGYCIGGTGVNITLNGSTPGVKYQLYNGTTAVGSLIPGTGFAFNFGLQTAAGSYNVRATDTATGCQRAMTGSVAVTINPLPNIYPLTGGGGYCPGSAGVHVGLSGSDLNVNYQLTIGATASGSFAGTGAPLDFGLETTVANYTVTALNTITGCSANMLGFSSVSVNALPSLFLVTGPGGSYCAGGAGLPVGLSGSATGINYQLYRNGIATGSPIAGGSIVPFTFGPQTAAGNYTVVATSTVTGCTQTMTGNAVIAITPPPTVYTVTGGGSFCIGGTGTYVSLNGSTAGVNYQLYNGGPVGGVVGGTGSPLNFGPFTATGTYTIIATNPVTTCTVNMLSSASIATNALPVPQAVSGGGSYCAGGGGRVVGMATSTVGVNYQLSNGSAAIGGPVPGTGAAFNFGSETLPGTYTVVAANASTGCTNSMTGSATVTVNPLPEKDTVTGGGNYCSGGTGVHVGISNTVSGVTYQLFDGTITVGFPVTGAGGAYDFGAQLAAGAYTVVATDVNGCMNTMYGSGVVAINPLPGSYFVAGGGSHCPGAAGLPVLLNGSDMGFNYQLLRDAATVGSPMAGTGVFLNFGIQSAAGVYTVVATNPLTGCTKTMTGSTTVSIAPLPDVDTVTGGGNYCPGGAGASVSLNTSATGVNYQLFHDGFMTGTAVAGTGDLLDFGPQTATGAYTVVATDATTTCSANMFGSVHVGNYPTPAAFMVSGGGSFCPGGTGINVIISGSETGVSYQLLNGTTAEGSPLDGTGSGLNFGAQTATGTYTVLATNAGTGCTSTMTHTATVTNYPLPGAFVVTGGGGYCVGGLGVPVTLAGSAVGINYQLYNNSVAIGGAIAAGTGSGINFGNQAAGGNYTVIATNASTGCTNNMTGSTAITISSLPVTHTVSGSGASYCEGGAGIDVSIDNTDAGVNYQLYRAGAMIGVPVLGTGSAIDFGLQTVAGTYTVVAINATLGCTSNMAGSASISITPLPSVNNVIGGGGYCAGSGGIHIGLDGSMAGVSYQLQNGGVNFGAAVSGTGAALDLGAQTFVGTYTVVATNTGSGCTSSMAGTATISINALPGVFAVTGGGNYCAGADGVAIGLSGSDPVGVTYQLQRGGTSVGAPVAATGGAISFGLQTAAGAYTVVATNAGTSCSVSMASGTNIVVNTLPAVYSVTGGGGYCADGIGVTVGLSSSTPGISYQLFRGVFTVGGTVAGTGSSLNFGTQSVAGAYTVMATNGATTCANTMAGAANVIVNPLPTVNNVTGGGTYCPGSSGVHVGLDGSNSGVLYQISINGSVSGSPITGTGAPLDLGLQTGIGSYTVAAANAATGCTSNMAGSVSVSLGSAVTPAVTINTGMGDTVCSGTVTTFSALATNQGAAPVYHWSVNGVAASLGSSYTYTPSNGDNISVTLNSDAACATPATVSNSIVMSVLNNALPSVVVSTSPGSEVCQGTVVNYTANPMYGGTAPIFTWLKNGITVAAGSDYSYAPNDSDIVSCRMTSNYTCRLANIVSSNNILMQVDQPVIPVVTISASPSAHVNEGDLVTLTATVSNGGIAPVYQWYVNGVPIPDGVTPILSSSNFVNGDSVTIQVTSSGACSNLVGFNSLRIFTNVGVTQVTNTNSNIALVPNPNKGDFTVKGTLGIVTDEEVSLEVYDMLGQLVYKNTVMTHGGNVNEHVQLNGGLANGMYMLNLHSATQKSIFHFVIEQ